MIPYDIIIYCAGPAHPGKNVRLETFTVTFEADGERTEWSPVAARSDASEEILLRDNVPIRRGEESSMTVEELLSPTNRRSRLTIRCPMPLCPRNLTVRGGTERIWPELDSRRHAGLHSIELQDLAAKMR
ncbi:hypothetical protein SAMN06295879_1013 [Agreia bicolorata]|uniref:Uncharacterized protein n=1 Tax=Agreia bicolorata TaxID=110935 RepID=A0A1T4XC02_9MICO|nr:hypothetical protein [Agreia bicolorata]SKA86969.1 hypothetical protein SAMN06295879_1013 [Agreia bicolorata]